jgi:serine/threonine protein kinase
MKIYHPNIIKILGIFEENQKLYIVLEYCAGGDFYDFVKNNGF